MKLTIDGRAVEVPPGATVLDAVNRLEIGLPQLCKDPDRAPLGACRTCLVHVDGQRGTPAACHLPARDGMVVDTQHPEVARVRATVLDLTRSMLTPGEHRNGFGQLGAAAARHGRLEPSWAPMHAYEEDATKSFFVLDRDACILCGRCAVACDDVQQIGAIALLGRGHATKVGVFGDGPMSSSVCTSCGQCVATCPTGALRPKEAPGKIARTVGTTCPYCGVGCGIELKVRDDGRLALMADDVPRNGSSLGMLCVKGRFATGFVHARDRITRPMIKRDGRWHEASWDEALDAAADGLAKHRGRFGALASAKATNEDGYLVQKFCRVVMATNDVDHCTRLCHSPSVEAMLASMGSGATSNSYQDYEESGCLLVVGADASANHPVIAIRFRRAVARGARLVVVNPKRIELCDQADLWLQQRPGTDVALFNAMARVILDDGLAKFETRGGARQPARPGRVVTEMIEGCLDGATRALYVVGEKPLLSEPDLHHAEKAIGQLEFLIVQDLFMHETAERAHVFLPAAAFAEKEGTFTNSERRVQRVREALPPPGEARPDWWITCELATRLEVAIHPSDARRLGVDTGSRIRVASRRGELTGHARVTEAVRPGAVFVPFVKLEESAANFLTNSAFDPSSKIPEYKVCAVRVERVPE